MDTQNTIEYVYKLTDNVSATASQISQSSAKAQQSVDSLSNSQTKVVENNTVLKSSMESAQVQSERASTAIQQSQARAQESTDSTLIRLTAQMTSLGALSGAIGGISSSMSAMGLISDDTAESLTTVANAFKLVASAGAGLSAIRTIMVLINEQQAIANSLKAFSTVLDNPAMLAAVGVAGGAAIATAGYYLTNNNSSTTINVQDTSASAKATGNEIYSMINGGAL